LARKRRLFAVLASAACAALLAACGQTVDHEVKGVRAVAAPSCDAVEYEGGTSPSKLIVSDLPMHGDSAERSRQLVLAMEQEMARKAWLAGRVEVAFQACDDSLASTGEWDPERCRQNARAYAADPDVIGVIGAYDTGCAAEQIPILNKAPGGGLAMVSPANAFVCLTQSSPTLCKPDEPGRYYPSGSRNFVRVVPDEAVQGAGLALFANGLGVRNPYVLYAADDPVSKGQGETFQGAAGSIGMRIAGFEQWDPKASGYSPLMQKVRASGADAVVLAGMLEQNGGRIIKDKVAALGPNTGRVKLIALDGFAQQATIDQAGPASKGMFVSLPGKSPASLIGQGDVFVKEIRAQVGHHPVDVYAPYAGQAVAELLKAIAQGPTRAETIRGLFTIPTAAGIVGTFTITPSGDPYPAPISISTAGDSFELAKTIVPPPGLVQAARGG
jgi:branched-chain amino acid transport system substrate-binding protein